ncbi:NAD(P)-binding protein [Xylona heveae TC161]|uniref:NAD(P)-binding protein n=1 Tax=Xylona heveae (strain CBS 132557 / TC161) TaxID=1328760 RepID=A0A165GDY7_XYLHT|nr:NAD(P)-binding protein [Xylona heveae TC161]KZF22076.1 NAD(P)-binding protein [Xylona heveae TC161]
MVQNKGLIFKSVPEGLPVKGKDLVIEDRPIDLNAQLPKDGVLLRNFYLSFDPYQRGRMRPANTKSYAQAFTLGEPIVNDGIAKVVKSANPAFKEGDVVLGHLRTEEYSVIPGDKIGPVKLSKLENPRNLDPKLFLGALGMPGLTAYASFYEIGEPKKGETIFISAASGAVGQIVGQLAKHEGLKVIGSVGDDAKAKFITEELNFDSVFNYKKEKPLDALKRLAPDGIDIYFENVGGETLDAVLEQINNYGRISKSNLRPMIHEDYDLFAVTIS